MYTIYCSTRKKVVGLACCWEKDIWHFLPEKKRSLSRVLISTFHVLAFSATSRQLVFWKKHRSSVTPQALRAGRSSSPLPCLLIFIRNGFVRHQPLSAWAVFNWQALAALHSLYGQSALDSGRRQEDLEVKARWLAGVLLPVPLVCWRGCVRPEVGRHPGTPHQQLPGGLLCRHPWIAALGDEEGRSNADALGTPSPRGLPACWWSRLGLVYF